MGYVNLVRHLLPSGMRNVMFDRTAFGEKHRWMYDRHSLKELLEDLGFSEIQFVGPEVSQIPDFIRYHLDCEVDHTPYKQSSLYCEAFR